MTDQIRDSSIACTSKTAKMSDAQPANTILSRGLSSIMAYFRTPVAAILVAVLKGIDEPSTIPISIRQATSAIDRSSKRALTFAALVTYLIYAAIGVGTFIILSVFKSIRSYSTWIIIPDSPEDVRLRLERYYNVAKYVLPELLGLLLILIYFYCIIKKLDQPTNVEAILNDPPAPERAPQATPSKSAEVPLVDGHFKKPPGASYVSARTAPPQEGHRASSSTAPNGSTSRSHRRVPTGTCGKPAHECRETEQQFDRLVNLDIQVSEKAHKAQLNQLEAGMKKDAEAFKSRFERIETDNRTLKQDLAEAHEELKTLEDLVDPEVKKKIGELNEQLRAKTQELAAAQQQFEKEMEEREALLKERKTRHELLLAKLDEIGQNHIFTTEKWRRKLFDAYAESAQMRQVQGLLTHYKKMYAESLDREHHAAKREREALRRREDLEKRAFYAEGKLREIKTGNGQIEESEPVMYQRESGVWA